MWTDAFRHGRAPVLGAHRFLYAVLVFLQHSVSLHGLDGGLGKLGSVGVFLFFSISGFIVVYAYRANYRGRPGSFLANRTLRIYPTLWFALALAAVLSLIGLSHSASGSSYGMWQTAIAITAIFGNLDGSVWNLLPPAWSLHVELKFYVILAVLYLAAESSERWGRLLLPLAGLAIMAGYVWTAVSNGHNRFYGELQYGPYFIVGVAFCYVRYHRAHPAALALLLLGLTGAAHHLVTFATWTETDGSQSLVPLSVYFVGMLTLGLTTLADNVSPRLRHYDRILGDLTYPFYLIHFPVLGALTVLGLDNFWIAGFVVLASSAGVLALVERPIARLRTRLRGHPAEV